MNNSNSRQDLVISVVVPLYREEKNVVEFIERLANVFDKIPSKWEVVFALDPSPDGTEQTILKLIEEGYPIRLITFTRRIGKPLSVLAGLDHCRGDVCVVSDVDLQDPPELIEKMLEKWRDGFQVVLAQRILRRGENFFYLTATKIFYWLLERIGEVKVPRDTGDFMLLDVSVAKQVCRLRERHAFLRGLVATTGFRTTVITYDRAPRFAGRARISLMGAVNIALDGIVPFSRTPVRVIFVFGIGCLLTGFLGFIGWFVSSLWTGFSPHWPVVLLSLTEIGVIGITMVALGILGEYLVRTYEETRHRPLYIVDQITEADTLSRKLSEDVMSRANVPKQLIP